MNSITETNAVLGTAIARLLPRILTQASRDPNSATYGSFDRDWWHYRIRDFSSVILQQGAWTAPARPNGRDHNYLSGKVNASSQGGAFSLLVLPAI